MIQVTNKVSQVPSAGSLANDIRDIKPPMAIPNGWEWLWVLAALAVIAVAILLWRWWQRKKTEARIEIEIPPHERARRKLQEALDYFDRPKPFCILVSDAVRLYLEERFGLRAPERTTEEFLADLGRSVALTDPQKASLQGFLTACDMVKFAKYEPQRQELEFLYNSALRLIEETEPKETEIALDTSIPNADSGALSAAREPRALPDEIVNHKS
jgi:hypothetical protein